VTLKYGLEVTQGHSNWYYSKAWMCGFLFAFYSNCGSVLYHFQDKVRYWSKIAIFFIPPCIWSISPSEYCHPVLCGKTRMVWLPEGEKKFEDTCKPFWQNSGVWRTDRRTNRDLATA